MTTLRPARLLPALLLSVALLGGACSGGSDDGGSAGGSTASEADSGAEAAAPAALSEVGAGASSDGSGTPALDPADDRRAIVRTGTVDYRAAEVRAVRTRVLEVLRPRGVEVAEESTDADEDGVAVRTTMTLRVRSDAFTQAMADLESLGGEDLGGEVTVVDSGSTSTDVSDQVIDVDVRVALQRRSIERISDLLDRAGSIRDVVGIERELARREADLGSLQRRQAFVADQTSLSTVTVTIERADADTSRDDDDGGFLAGLAAGRDAFSAVATGLLTATGAALPFLAMALLVGVPLRVLVRRRRAAAPVRV